MNYGIIGSYSGDSFRNLVFKYSCDRMSRDRRYRKQVIEKLEARKAEKTNGNVTSNASTDAIASSK